MKENNIKDKNVIVTTIFVGVASLNDIRLCNNICWSSDLTLALACSDH